MEANELAPVIFLTAKDADDHVLCQITYATSLDDFRAVAIEIYGSDVILRVSSSMA